MKKIALTQGKFALVDDKDFEFLNQWKWYLRKDKQRCYAVRTINSSGKIYMHREIIKVNEGKHVDHINGDGLDNRCSNLRECTIQQNQWNSKKQINNSLGYKGVYKSGSRFRARLFVLKKGIHGGTYDTPREAALAYNKLASKHFGAFANLNEV